MAIDEKTCKISLNPATPMIDGPFSPDVPGRKPKQVCWQTESSDPEALKGIFILGSQGPDGDHHRLFTEHAERYELSNQSGSGRVLSGAVRGGEGGPWRRLSGYQAEGKTASWDPVDWKYWVVFAGESHFCAVDPIICIRGSGGGCIGRQN